MHWRCIRSSAKSIAWTFTCFFVDEHLRTIYGNRLDQLEKPHVARDGVYPQTRDWKEPTRVWSLEQMILFGRIEDDVCAIQAHNSQRGYDYAPTGKTFYKRIAKRPFICSVSA